MLLLYTLRSAFLMPKAVKFLQILQKVYIKRQISPDPSADVVNTVKCKKKIQDQTLYSRRVVYLIADLNALGRF